MPRSISGSWAQHYEATGEDPFVATRRAVQHAIDSLSRRTPAADPVNRQNCPNAGVVVVDSVEQGLAEVMDVMAREEDVVRQLPSGVSLGFASRCAHPLPRPWHAMHPRPIAWHA